MILQRTRRAKSKPFGILLPVCLLFGALPLSQVMEASQTRAWNVAPYTVLNDKFAVKHGWTGADGAYSIPINAKETVWTFGDTFIGDIQDNQRIGARMVNNSIAIQKPNQPDAPLSFHWGRTLGEPRAMWVTGEAGTYFWPGDGAAIDGKLFVFLHKIKPDTSQPEPFQFRALSDTLACVDNPNEPVELWRTSLHELGNDSAALQYATACLLHGNYLYLYCSYRRAAHGLDAHPAILARILKEDLTRGRYNAFEYLCDADPYSCKGNSTANSKKGNSKADLKANLEASSTANSKANLTADLKASSTAKSKANSTADLKASSTANITENKTGNSKASSKAVWLKELRDPIILFPDAAPEMSVTTISGMRGFYAVYMPPLSKEICLRQAPAPEGPWGERIKLYDCPEKDDSTLVYSAKTHQELTKVPRQLIITYCRNTRQFGDHIKNASVYFPQAIKLSLER